MSEYNTQPTIQTLLEEMQKGFAAMKGEFDAVHSEIGEIKRKMIRQDERIDNFIEEVIDLKRKLRSTV